MIGMSRFRRPRCQSILLVLPLLFAAGCSRPVGLHSDDNTAQASQREVPFQNGVGNEPSSNAGSEHNSTESGLPFRDDQSLPVGTMLTVRLKTPIAADKPGASGTFEAVVDEPLMIDGNILIPRGSTVAGRVESARAFKASRNRGYVRLILDSIDVAGRELPVQTSSLFARGNLDDLGAAGGDTSPAVIHLEKGRRLTFRLTEPVYMASQRPIPAH
jgi:hypothetical protein